MQFQWMEIPRSMTTNWVSQHGQFYMPCNCVRVATTFGLSFISHVYTICTDCGDVLDFILDPTWSDSGAYYIRSHIVIDFRLIEHAHWLFYILKNVLNNFFSLSCSLTLFLPLSLPRSLSLSLSLSALSLSLSTIPSVSIPPHKNSLTLFVTWSHSKYAVTAIVATRIVCESGRYLDVIMFGIRIHVAHGICCCQQFHGTSRYKNDERLFGREFRARCSIKWWQLKGMRIFTRLFCGAISSEI